MTLTSASSRRTGAIPGAILWMLSIQYYIVQLIVAASWRMDDKYSWTRNTISDLANTHCGLYGDRLVCSPLHTIMNLSFVLLGATMIGGAYLMQKQFASDFMTRLGFGFMILAGIGTILIGLFPENTISALHITGAALPFIFGNAGMIILGLKLQGFSGTFRIYSIISGAVGLIALVLFETHIYIGLGAGGIERLIAYPQSIWMIAFGIYVLSLPKKVPIR